MNSLPIISSRDKQVWTSDEKRRITRVAKDFHMHGDKLLMRCGNPVCPDDRIVIHADESQPTGAVLRCGCTDRVFSYSC